MSLYTHKSSNIRKTWLLFTLFFIVVISIGWLFSYIFNSPAILYAAVIFSVLTNIWAYWYSDKLVLKMVHAREVSFNQNPELHRVVENLAITAGLPKPKIFVIESNQLNAFATGRNPQHAVVAVTNGLLDRLDRSELEGVLAHELSHIGNRDMLVSTITVVLAGLIAIASDFFLRWLWWGGGRRRDSRAGSLIMILGVVGAVLAPLAAMLIQLAISRKREFLADSSGALLTRYPEGLAKALEKIGSDSQPLAGASHANAHLFLANPFKGKAGVGFMAKLFMTHPPVEDRIKVLRGMQV